MTNFNEKSLICKRSIRIQNRSSYTVDRMGKGCWGTIAFDSALAKDGQSVETLTDDQLEGLSVPELTEVFRQARSLAAVSSRGKDLAGRAGVILGAKMEARNKFRF